MKKYSIKEYLGNEKKLIVPGLLFSFFTGSIMPICGLLLAKIIGVL